METSLLSPMRQQLTPKSSQSSVQICRHPNATGDQPGPRRFREWTHFENPLALADRRAESGAARVTASSTPQTKARRAVFSAALAIPLPLMRTHAHFPPNQFRAGLTRGGSAVIGAPQAFTRTRARSIPEGGWAATEPETIALEKDAAERTLRDRAGR
jgi:hypothetical protein